MLVKSHPGHSIRALYEGGFSAEYVAELFGRDAAHFACLWRQWDAEMVDGGCAVEHEKPFFQPRKIA